MTTFIIGCIFAYAVPAVIYFFQLIDPEGEWENWLASIAEAPRWEDWREIVVLALFSLLWPLCLIGQVVTVLTRRLR